MVAWLARRVARFTFYGDDFPLRDLFEYLVLPKEVGHMQWMKMFATQEVIRHLSEADWTHHDGEA
jgi:hypothetical protein